MYLQWTREGMATLAALNVLVNPYVSPSWVHSYDHYVLYRKTDESPYNLIQGKIKGYPVWFDANRVEPFLNENGKPPAACPSIVNAKALSKNIFRSFTGVKYFCK